LLLETGTLSRGGEGRKNAQKLENCGEDLTKRNQKTKNGRWSPPKELVTHHLGILKKRRVQKRREQTYISAKSIDEVLKQTAN